MTVVAAPASPARPRRRAARWAPWVVLLAVAVVALGIGVQRHSNPTLEQRTMSIANAVRCPVCSGETAAQSDTAQSLEIQAEIRQDLQAGQSRTQILATLEASFGPSILEKPSTKGINLLLWVLPGLAVLLAIGGLVVVFARWRLARVSAVSDEDRLLVGGALDAPPGPPGNSDPLGSGDAEPWDDQERP